MQFGRDFVYPEGMGFPIHGGHIPTTPSKPEEMSHHVQRPHWADTVSAATRLCGRNFSQEVQCQNGASSSVSVEAAAMESGSISFAEIGNWEAAVASQTRVSGLDAYAGAFRNATDKWNRMSSASISAGMGTFPMAAAQNGWNSLSSFRPILHSQNLFRSQEGESSSMNMKHMSQNSMPGQNLERNSYFLPQTPQLSAEQTTKQTTSCPYHTTSHFRNNYATNHLSTPANNIADAVTNGCLSFQQDQESSANHGGVGFCTVNDRVIRSQKQEDELPPVITPPTGAEPVKIQQAVSEPAVLSTPVKEIRQACREEGQIDLNKTPLQKHPKRKKHMPKVVVEGKPKRTPKPATPAKDPLRPKRKYVRKSGPKAVKGVPSPDVGQSTNPTKRQAVRSCKRQLDFNLEDQGTDGCTTMNKVFHSMQNSTTRFFSDPASLIQPSNLSLESEAQVGYTGVNRNSEPMSTKQIAPGLEVVVGQALSGPKFDLNCSFTQLAGDCISIPNLKKSLSVENTEAPLKKEENGKTVGTCKSTRDSIPLHQNVHVRESERVISPRQSTHVNSETDRIVIQNVHQSATNAQPHSTSSQNVQPLVKKSLGKVSKREHVNAVCLSPSPSLSPNPSPGSKFLFAAPETCKKRRMDMTHDELTPNVSALIPSGNGIIQTTMNMIDAIGSNAFMIITSQGKLVPPCSFLKQNKEPSNGISNASPSFHSNSVVGEHNEKSPSSSREMNLCVRTHNGIEFSEQRTLTSRVANARAKETVHVNDMRLLLAAREPQQLQRTSVKVDFAHNKRQEGNVFHDVQCHPQAIANEKMKNQLAHLASSVFPPFTDKMPPQEHKRSSDDYCQSLVNSRTTSLGKNHAVFATFPSQCIQPKSLNNNSTQDCPISSDIQYRPETMFPGVIMLQMDPTFKLDEERECSNIKGSTDMVAVQEQNALVPYARNGPLLPLASSIHPTKTKQPRPIVHLDKETESLWAILMAHSSDETPGAMDAEKEKWWEEQRRVFQGRVDSFIARMHLVQGDRRFSRWKGSVVDSVVGVFLTQNVSDHLSSSAFMNLAARFPPKTKTNSGAEQTSISEDEQNTCVLDSYKWQNEIRKKDFQKKGSITFNVVETLEEKEIASWNESFSSNMGLSSLFSSKDRYSSICQNLTEVWQESEENAMTIMHSTTEGASLSDVDDQRGLEDVVSSQKSVISYQNSAESTIQKTDQNMPVLESNFDEDNLILEFNGSMSFTKLLQMDGSDIFEKFHRGENLRTSSKENLESATSQFETRSCEKGKPYLVIDGLGDASTSTKITESYRGQLTTAQTGGLSRESKHAFHLSSNLAPKAHIEWQQFFNLWERMEVPSDEGAYSEWSHTQSQKNFCSPRGDGMAESQPKCIEALEVADHWNQVEASYDGQHLEMQQNHSNLPHLVGDRLYDAESLSTANKQKIAEINLVHPSASDEASTSKNTLATATKNTPNRRKEKSAIDKTNDFDWENLRRQVCHNRKGKERNSDEMDAVDWEAVRCADVKEISESIKERGMNNMLAERIQEFLNRVARDHGSVDLEWLRDVAPEKAKEYFLSIRGLGLKSTECVRLLTLHHVAFPVDTNVGRVSVRLGWVPLQPLPESLQIHLLEQYPLLASIQKYLWPRLCKFDQRTLYELHYQMITFGKVFCTKRNPNCNACPMRAECKHFASAFASARLALPGPEEKSLVSPACPAAEQGPKVVIHPLQLPSSAVDPHPKEYRSNQCEPIIEEPATPEPEPVDASEAEIEDAFWQEDPDDIPTIKLNLEEFTTNVQNFMNENNKGLQDANWSKALVTLSPQAASIPMPKLKNVGRLRTEHQVYELPDSHPLLAELDQREPDDPCPYLLAIWTPGETADSVEPPGFCSHSQGSNSLCDQKTCFSCNSIREANSHTVRGTLLIPCRTAMRGRFPLNGTYFQVNEVFADHDSSLQPIDVPREWIWNLPRRIVFFGTSIPTIFQGLTMEGIQQCFWRGFVCVRGFDQKTRAPRPLTARQHLPASKLLRLKRRENSKADKTEDRNATSTLGFFLESQDG